jgi:hypothetical protein
VESAVALDALELLNSLTSIFPESSKLRRALGIEYMRGCMLIEVKLSFNTSVRLAMTEAGVKQFQVQCHLQWFAEKMLLIGFINI